MTQKQDENAAKTDMAAEIKYGKIKKNIMQKKEKY